MYIHNYIVKTLRFIQHRFQLHVAVNTCNHTNIINAVLFSFSPLLCDSRLVSPWRQVSVTSDILHATRPID